MAAGVECGHGPATYTPLTLGRVTCRVPESVQHASDDPGGTETGGETRHDDTNMSESEKEVRQRLEGVGVCTLGAVERLGASGTSGFCNDRRTETGHVSAS